MVEKSCDLWIESADCRCILVSGAVASDGTAQLDWGTAAEAVQRYPGIDIELGRMISARGNHAHVIRPGLISFPVKQFHFSLPTLDVIERSARELVALVGAQKTLLPDPTRGSPMLKWEDVAPRLAFMPDNVVVLR